MKTVQLVRGGNRKCGLADAHADNLIKAVRIVEKWLWNQPYNSQ